MSNGRLDYIPGNSVFHRAHVVVKLALMLCILLLMFTINNIAVLVLLLALTIAIYNQSGIPWSYFRGLSVLVPAILISLIGAQALWYSGNRTPMFDPIMLPFRINFSADDLRANALTLYWEGVYFGVILGLRMLGMFLSFPIVFLTTPTAEFIEGLTEVKLPYQVAFVFTTAFRFIPFLFASRERVMEAQRLRGIELEGKGMLSRVSQTVPTIVPMITSALRLTNDLEIAIESRAFGAFPKRTSYHSKKFTDRDRWTIFVLLAATILLAVAVNVFLPHSV